MSVFFKTLCSSSRGNCALLWTDTTRIAIDCGFGSQRACKQSLQDHADGVDRLDAVIVSHGHTDHINYSGLRVLAMNGVRIRAHARVVSDIFRRHGYDRWDEPPVIEPFNNEPLTIGDFKITAIEVPHAPSVPTYGFVIEAGEGSGRKKIVYCTDFHDFSNVAGHFIDADFIFVECNHDLELLRKRFNYASLFHLSNPKSAQLLCDAVRKSRRPPQAVMLGHLSKDRNDERLAVGSVVDRFRLEHVGMDFELSAAPVYVASRTVCIK